MLTDNKTITFELAEPKDSEDYKGSSQTVEVLTDLRQRCSRCKTMVLGEPMSLHLVDLVSQDERHKAQHAVAKAMYNVESAPNERHFDDIDYPCQSKWLREAAVDGWKAESFNLDAVGLGATKAAREAGIVEAKKWSAYTDRRKVFEVGTVKLPPGWLTLSFEARGSKNGQPVQHGYVMAHICPACAPAIFDAVNVDPMGPEVGLAWSREVESWFCQCERAVADLTKDGNADVANGICEAVQWFYEQHGEKPPAWTQI